MAERRESDSDVLPLEYYHAEIADRTMLPEPVVEDLNDFEDRLSVLGASLEVLPVDQFHMRMCLKLSKAALS